MNKSEEIRREEPCSVMKPSCEEPAVNSSMKSGVYYGVVIYKYMKCLQLARRSDMNNAMEFSIG